MRVFLGHADLAMRAGGVSRHPRPAAAARPRTRLRGSSEARRGAARGVYARTSLAALAHWPRARLRAAGLCSAPHQCTHAPRPAPAGSPSPCRYCRRYASDSVHDGLPRADELCGQWRFGHCRQLPLQRSGGALVPLSVPLSLPVCLSLCPCVSFCASLSVPRAARTQ